MGELGELGAMTDGRGRRGGLTRREAMARALRTGVYAAPVLLSASALASHVGASPPPPVVIACGTAGLSYTQDALLLGVFAGSTYNLYAQPNTVGSATLIGTFTADAEGVAYPAAPLLVTVPFGTTSVTVSVYLTPSGGAPPGPPTASFDSLIAGTLACTSGASVPVTTLTPRLLAKVIQEQTSCPAGAAAAWQELVDVNLVNASPSAGYDIYVQASNGTAGGFVSAGRVTTNGQGNGGAVLPVTVATTGTGGVGAALGAPGTVTVRAVPAGTAPTAAGALSVVAAPTGDPTTSTLITISCAGAIAAQSVRKPILVGVH